MKTAHRAKALAKNTFIISFGTFLPKLTGLITLPIITASLTRTEYGTFDLLTTMASLALPVLTLQIHLGAFRYLIDVRDQNERKTEIITTIVGFVTIVTFLVISILFFVLYRFDITFRVLLCLFFAAEMFLAVLQQIVRGLSYNKLYSIGAIVQSLTNAILIVTLLNGFHFGLNGLLLSSILSMSIGSFILAYFSKIIRYIHFDYFSGAAFKELLSYSWPMIPNTLSLWAMNLSNRLIITAILGLEANAIFAIANKIPLLFSTVQATFTMAWQENASIVAKDTDASHYYSNMFHAISCILVGIMAVLIALTPVIFRVVIRGDYEEAYLQMPILFIGVLMASVSSFLGGIYVAFKKTKNVGMTTIAAAAINVTLTYIFVGQVGITGASISILLSYVFLVIYRMINITKFQPMSYKTLQLLSMLGILVMMCFICYQKNMILDVINGVIAITVAVGINKNLIGLIWKRIKK